MTIIIFQYYSYISIIHINIYNLISLKKRFPKKTTNLKMNQIFSYKLQSYYNNRISRIIINTLYLLNLIILTIYLLFIPIQIAYSWLLLQYDNGFIQNIIDITILFIFILHIGLYLDQKLYQWMKSPYIKWYRKLITIQLVYDVFCVFLSIILVILVNKSKEQQFIQLFLLGKVYKLMKYDIKCMYVVIGTWFYPIYKIVRTLLILFLVISYVGSLFYGVAYYLYTIGIQYDFLLWIVETPAIIDCVNQPFLIQLQYAMYWALGTASTAAYGDISASQPTLVLINIFALAFQGFLFGFYLNSMHSIPIESKQKQADLLQKFDAFQQHSSNRKIDKKLHLQILCSLQYTESQKKKMDEIQKFLPKQYLQQIKFNIYKKILDDPIFFSNSAFQLQITQKVGQTVSQMGQDVYNYRNVHRNDLLYLKQGSIKCYLTGQLKFITMQIVEKGDYIGLHEFITGLLIPQRAICINYCFLYRIARQDYKKLLPEQLKLQFNKLQMRGFLFEGNHLNKQPIVKLIKNILQNQSQFVFFNLQIKQRIMLQKYKRTINQRKLIKRSQKSRKIYIPKQIAKTRNQQTQTDKIQGIQFQQVYIWNHHYGINSDLLLN